MKKLIATSTILTLAALFVFAGFGFACGMKGTGTTKTDAQLTGVKACPNSLKTETAKVSAEGENIMLNVTGMTCQGCINSITKSLAAVEGVTDVVVSLEEGTARVTYDAKVKPEALTAAVVSAGYKAEVAGTDETSGKELKSDAGSENASSAFKAGSKAACISKKSCNPSACPLKAATDE